MEREKGENCIPAQAKVDWKPEWSFRLTFKAKGMSDFKKTAGEMLFLSGAFKTYEDAMNSVDNYLQWFGETFLEFRLFFPGPKLCFSLTPILDKTGKKQKGILVGASVQQNGGVLTVCQQVKKAVLLVLDRRGISYQTEN